MQTATDYRFNVYDMMSALIYSRVVHPCSKSKTYYEVLPKFFENSGFSLDQIYTGLEYMGWEYEKIIQLPQMTLLLPQMTYFAFTAQKNTGIQSQLSFLFCQFNSGTI